MRPDQVPPSPSWRGRKAAMFVGGKRHRLTRRPTLPRSQTTPVLLPSPTVPTSSTSANYVDYQRSQHDTPQPTSSCSTNDPNMEFYPPCGMFTPKEAQSSSKPRKPKPAPYSTPSKGSEPREVEGRDQQHSNNQVGALTSDGQPLEPQLLASPLPPSTPSKAAQFLGLDPDTTKIDTAQANKPLDEYHKAQHSSSNTSFRQTRFREEGVEPNQPKSKKFTWGFSGKNITKKSQRQDSRPNMDYYHYHQQEIPIPEPPAPPPPPPSAPVAPPIEEHVDTPVTYEFVHERPYQHQPSDRFSSSQRVSAHRMRKKGPRSLDRMTPITEVSHDELHTAYRESDHLSELDVISEYEDNYPPRKSSKIVRSQTVAALPNTQYRIYEDDISEWDNDESESEEEDYMAHPGSQVNLSKMIIPSMGRLDIKSPLQKVEGVLLDEQENEIQEHKTMLDREALQSAWAAQTSKVHGTVSEIKMSHERMKKNFYAYQHGSTSQSSPLQCSECSDNSDGDDDLVSISSSIDLEEEPVVLELKKMTVTKVLPGTVKTIDIPPRRRQYTEHADSIITTGYHPENVIPSTQRAINNDSLADAQTEPETYGRHSKEKRAKMPREESQILTRDWILKSPRPSDQQPLSMCFDADLLADQEIPPAPVLKDLMPTSPLPLISKGTADTPPPSPPPKNAARKHPHMCVRDGHLFCRIDLRKSVGNRQLSLSQNRAQPLRWEAQKEQHGEATLCEKCNNTVYEEIYECEIPVCRTALCSDCAMDIGSGRRQGAIKSWDHAEWGYKSLSKE